MPAPSEYLPGQQQTDGYFPGGQYAGWDGSSSGSNWYSDLSVEGSTQGPGSLSYGSMSFYSPLPQQPAQSVTFPRSQQPTTLATRSPAAKAAASLLLDPQAGAQHLRHHPGVQGKVRIERASFDFAPAMDPRQSGPRQCKEPDCGMFFTRSSDLNRHRNDIHAYGEKIYKCSGCGYAKQGRADKVKEHVERYNHGKLTEMPVESEAGEQTMASSSFRRMRGRCKHCRTCTCAHR